MGDVSKISAAGMREALAAIRLRQDECLAEWKEFAATVPRRMNDAQRERSAYLRGRLRGLHQAYREFEMRAPLELRESSETTN